MRLCRPNPFVGGRLDLGVSDWIWLCDHGSKHAVMCDSSIGSSRGATQSSRGQLDLFHAFNKKNVLQPISSQGRPSLVGLGWNSAPCNYFSCSVWDQPCVVGFGHPLVESGGRNWIRPRLVESCCRRQKNRRLYFLFFSSCWPPRSKWAHKR